MTRPTDEALMAYVDGHLDATSRRAVERHLLSDVAAQRFVHMMTLATAMARQAFGDQDFTRGMDRLVKQIERGSIRPRAKGQSGQLNLAWLTGHGFASTGLGGAAWIVTTAVAGIAVAWLALAAVPERLDGHPTARTAIQELSLGEVRRGTTLRAALDGGPTSAASAGEFERYRTIAEFKDKFGNTCRELDAFDNDSDRLPSAVVVACRGLDLSWSVLGVVATRTSRTATYAADAVQAHDAMAGVLELLGANRRTSGLRNESEMR